MTHDPDRDQPSTDVPDDEVVVPDDAPETEHIQDEGEPLGGNVA